jgi:hypothetical protein
MAQIDSLLESVIACLAQTLGGSQMFGHLDALVC